MSGIVRRSWLILKSRSWKTWCRRSAIRGRTTTSAANNPLDRAEDIPRGMGLASGIRLPSIPTPNIDMRIGAPLLVWRRTPRSDIGVARTLRVRTLKLAADLVGGPRKLRDLLGVSSAEVAGWLSGLHEPSAPAFLRAIELILDHLDAADGGKR